MKHRRQAGYSLPEMLTVVAIIGVLALVTVPAFINFYQAGKMRASMRNFTTDLRSIRQRAITRGHQTILTYDVTASGAGEVNRRCEQSRRPRAAKSAFRSSSRQRSTPSGQWPRRRRCR